MKTDIDVGNAQLVGVVELFTLHDALNKEKNTFARITPTHREAYHDELCTHWARGKRCNYGLLVSHWDFPSEESIEYIPGEELHG